MMGDCGQEPYLPANIKRCQGRGVLLTYMKNKGKGQGEKGHLHAGFTSL
jgi:hypothetical protein